MSREIVISASECRLLNAWRFGRANEEAIMGETEEKDEETAEAHSSVLFCGLFVGDGTSLKHSPTNEQMVAPRCFRSKESPSKRQRLSTRR